MAGRYSKTMSRKQKQKNTVLLILIVIFMGIAFFCLHQWESSKSQLSGTSGQNQSEVWTVNGISYVPKDNIETYLFMGIDVSGPAKSSNVAIGTGQCDTLFLIVIDHDAQTWQILELNRDTMCEVQVMGVKGDVLSSSIQQLALAHSYGDGLKKSCNNTVEAVSALLNDVSIDGYYSLNMDGLALINDALGGVEVTITSDFSDIDESLVQGSTMVLNGKQATEFVRSRANIDDQTNTARMQRQQQYLSGLAKKLDEQNAQTLSAVLEDAHDYSVTNMGSKTFQKILEAMQSYTQLEMASIEGESVIENEHWAFYPDESSLEQTVLDLFYEAEK